MLLFLILCTLIQARRGSPFPLPLAISSVATADPSFAASESSDGGTQSLRSVAAIVKSCLLTILACVWTSIHPNIDGPTDSCWASTKRKAVIMFCAVIAPELVVFWAIQQYVDAKNIAKDYNKKFAILAVEKTDVSPPWRTILGWFLSPWRKIVGWFRPLPKETTRRGIGEPWTTTHGFFVQMGGFMLYESNYPKEVLTYKRLAQLIKEKSIDAPTVTERDLQDRGKGDATTKAIVLLQTTWFVVQCIARWAQHLPVTELEVLTLAFAVINVAIYAAWWNKPQGVEVAICVPSKTAKQENTNCATILTKKPLDEPENQAHSDEAGRFSQLSHQQSNRSVPLIRPSDQKLQPNEQIDDKGHSWLWHKLKEDRQNHSFPSFLLIRLPYRLSIFIFRPFYKIFDLKPTSKGPLRLPMLHDENPGRVSTTVELCLTLLGPLAVGTIFGAIHLAAWASEFPSHRDLVLWRISAIVLVVQPLLIALSGLLVVYLEDRASGWVENVINFFLFVPPVLLIPCYIAARFIVIFIAFKAIRHPPNSVLIDITWTTYIPHF